MMKNNYNVSNGKDRIRCFRFSKFEIYLTAFVSDFDIRISDFAALATPFAISNF